MLEHLSPYSRPPLFIMMFLFFAFPKCSDLRDYPDTQISECSASQCHPSTLLKQYPPASGKHTRHLNRGLICENCHNDYLNRPQHKNGKLDLSGDTVIVYFDKLNGSTIWDNSSDACSNIDCHGGAPSSISWYGDTAGCTECHTGGSTIDPVSTNGEKESGKHISHVQDQNISCNSCHNDYMSNAMHINGIYGRAEKNPVVIFDASNPWAQWDNENTSCSLMDCHGTLDWYSTGSYSCLSCHAPGTTYDPLTINGSGNSGKHIKHAGSLNYDCEKCHKNYGDAPEHRNGLLDTGDPSVMMTFFDSTNPAGQWIGDTGEGKGMCSSLACHGTSVPEWYGTASWSLPSCDTCHASVINSRRQILGTGGDFGANPGIKSHHITGSADPSDEQCKVCHDLSSHMGGTVILNNADDGTGIVYDPSIPSTLEDFCLSCHDPNGASVTFASVGSPLDPFGEKSGSDLLGIPPYSYAARISASWQKKYGHGSTNTDPADFQNVNVKMRTTGSRLTCMGSGAPGTGCHGSNGNINAHGSVNEVISAAQFDYSAMSQIYDESWFSLCFNCHSSYPGVTKEDILGVKEDGILDMRYGNMKSRPGDANKEFNPPYYISRVVTHFADHNAGSIYLGGMPQGIINAGGYIWVGLTYDDKVLKLDKSTGEILAVIAADSSPGVVNGFAYDSDNNYVWVTNQGSSSIVTKIKADDNSVTNVAIAQSGQYSIIYANASIWLTANGRLLQLDPATNSTLNTYDFSPKSLMGMAYDGQYIWLASGNEVMKIDPLDGLTVNTVSVGSSPYSVRYYDGYIWVANTGGGSITKIDPSSDSVLADIYAGDHPIDMTYDGQYLWVALNSYNGVSKIDISSDTVIDTYQMNGRSLGVAYDNSGHIMTTDIDNYSLTKLNISTGLMDGDAYGINDSPVHLTATKNSMNLHWYHMRFYTNFRGNEIPAPDTGAGEYFKRGELCDNCHRIFEFGKNLSCVNCHDVHGSDNPNGAVYDEIGYARVDGFWGSYGKLPDLIPDLDQYPAYCAYNCHNADQYLHQDKMDLKPPNKAWFDPITE